MSFEVTQVIPRLVCRLVRNSRHPSRTHVARSSILHFAGSAGSVAEGFQSFPASLALFALYYYFFSFSFSFSLAVAAPPPRLGFSFAPSSGLQNHIHITLLTPRAVSSSPPLSPPPPFSQSRFFQLFFLSTFCVFYLSMKKHMKQVMSEVQRGQIK